MDTMSYSSFRSHLVSTLDKVNDNHKPILITRQNGKPAVVISLEDFQAYEETAYLMASPKNAERLNEAISEIEAGKPKNISCSNKNLRPPPPILIRKAHDIIFAQIHTALHFNQMKRFFALIG